MTVKEMGAARRPSCRRKIEMSSGVQSRDDTAVGDGTTSATWTAFVQ
jgi:hypothetical protein